MEILGFVVMVIILVGLALAWEAARERERVERERNRLRTAISEHLDTLARRYIQLVKEDRYGNVTMKAWQKEMDDFMKAIGIDWKTALLIDAPRLITERASAHAGSLRVDLVKNEDFLNDPLLFEEYCNSVLQHRGWSARTTQQSGDQGIDVIASKCGVRIVLQCKLQSKPVGNGAIQAVYAGKSFELAHAAAVVTNTSYTKSAIQLADTLGVYLLHYSELTSLDVINGQLVVKRRPPRVAR